MMTEKPIPPSEPEIHPQAVVEGTSISSSPGLEHKAVPDIIDDSSFRIENPVKVTEKDSEKDLGEPVPPPVKIPVYTEEYTVGTQDTMKRSGIETEHIKPTPIRKSDNVLVFSYDRPDDKKRVVKLNAADEGKHFKTARPYFTERYLPETRFAADPETGTELIVQEAVSGSKVDSRTVKKHPEMRWQLGDIGAKNRRLYREKGISLNFLGDEGIEEWLRKQLRNLLFLKSTFTLPGIVYDENNKLRIVEFEFYDNNKELTLGGRLSNWFGMKMNRLILKHYFKVNV